MLRVVALLVLGSLAALPGQGQPPVPPPVPPVPPPPVQPPNRPWERSLDREGLAPIREAARELSRELEYLQEDIIADLAGRKELKLYNETDAILAEAARFQRLLKVGASREELYGTFIEMDRKLHALLERVQTLGPAQRLLQRGAARVEDADEGLHRTLAIDATEPRSRLLLERQAEVLARKAHQLEQTAQYALGAQPTRAVLIGELHKLTGAVEQFQKGLQSKANRAELRRDFAAVNRAWERAGREIQEVPPQNVYLLRQAVEVDQLHELLFRLLGMDGERPRIRVRT